ncbi:flagellar export protein FliJ [Thermodesulfobium sp.]
MKKFAFRFERLKKLRELERDVSLNAFSTSLQEFMHKEKEYKLMFKRVLNARNELNVALENGSSVDKINTLLNNVYILEGLLKGKRDELYSAYLKAKEDKADFLEKDIKRKVMEKIRDQHLRLYLKKLFKEDQSNIDEASSNIRELKRKIT